MLKCVISFVFISLLLTSNTVSSSWYPAQKSINYGKVNQVVLTCRGTGDDGAFLVGGQGEIYNTDQSGVWIITARHVSLNSDSCDVMFPDMSFHTAYMSKQFSKSDMSILFAPKAYWPTHASIVDLKLDTNLFVFSNIKGSPSRDDKGNLLGFFFNFDYAVHTGKAISYAPPEVLTQLGWPVPKGSVVFTNLYSRPGSSGGGVYDEEGNLVAIVSCGNIDNPNSVYIVDISKALIEEDQK